MAGTDLLTYDFVDVAVHSYCNCDRIPRGSKEKWYFCVGGMLVGILSLQIGSVVARVLAALHHSTLFGLVRECDENVQIISKTCNHLTSDT